MRIGITSGSYTRYGIAEGAKKAREHGYDNNGKADQHLTPGNGTIDWSDFGAALAEIGFEGCFSFETRVPSSIPVGEERDQLEKELADIGHKIAKNI